MIDACFRAAELYWALFSSTFCNHVFVSMSSLSPLPVNTASKTTSIWRDVEQSLFRQRIDDLHRKTDHCPGRPREFSQASWQAKAPSQILANHVLPFQVEERIANDIAFVAASRKDVESVSAVALEEHRDSQGLSVRIAANGSINSAVIETIEAVLSLLQDCARKSAFSRLVSRVDCLLSHVLSRAVTHFMQRADLRQSRRSQPRTHSCPLTVKALCLSQKAQKLPAGLIRPSASGT